MEGGPSHVDTFDYKPELTKRDGQVIGKGKVPNGRLMASPWKFQQGGKSGLWISDLYPELRSHADKLCLINSMQCDIPAHPPAFVQMHTGISTSPRPSMGAWILYGLGSENQNLPGFITISAPPGVGGSVNYGSAFLPAPYQGTRIGGDGESLAQAKVPHIRKPCTITVGRPINVERYRGRAEDHRVLRQITDELMFEIRELTGQEYRNVYAGKTAETEPTPAAAKVAHVGDELTATDRSFAIAGN
jgi:hypothetical protein